MGVNVRKVLYGRHKWRLYLLLILILTACTPAAPQVKRIALLTSFEGRYREIGYDAIYPLRLALKDADSDVVLVTVDDGGTAESALIQARRLAADPTILAALVIGPTATQPDVLAAFGDVPVIVIGAWDATPSETVFVLASENLRSVRTSHAKTIGVAVEAAAPLTGGELFALKQYADLRPNLDGITVALSASPPDSAFTERLIASDLFVPTPGALSSITYDVGGLIQAVTQSEISRDGVKTALKTIEYTGLNGQISFTTAGWWDDAPILEYSYSNGVLTLRVP